MTFIPSSTKAIFSPVKVGASALKHRVVLAPLTLFRATYNGVPNDLQIEYYTQRATEGGLLITEATFIDRTASPYKHVPGIYTDEQIEGWKKVTAAVHGKKAFIYLQIWHVGRAGFRHLNPNQEQVVSASDIRITDESETGEEFETPRALEVTEIKQIIGQFRQAALNAMEAGFDGVEIHGANGYLIDQFINSSSNRRTDIYGGSIENRARFALEVVDAVAGAIGSEKTAIRFSPGEKYLSVEDETEVETYSYLTSKIQNEFPNLSYLHFVQARVENHSGDIPRNPPNTLTPYRKIWKGPFISAGGYSTSTQYAIDLAEETGDLIAFGRAFIANPDLPERLYSNWSLNHYDRSTFLTHDGHGYIDYPFYNEAQKN
ncbi:unnamed protein product [Mucor hiemalis]